MSIFDTDWNNDGKIDEFDTSTDMFFINEMEKEQRGEEHEMYDDDCEFKDDYDCVKTSNVNMHNNYSHKESQSATMQQSTAQTIQTQQPVEKKPENQYVIIDKSPRAIALIIFSLIAALGVVLATLTMFNYPAMIVLIGVIILTVYGMFKLNNTYKLISEVLMAFALFFTIIAIVFYTELPR